SGHMVKVGEGLTTLLCKSSIVIETTQEANTDGPSVEDLASNRIMKWKTPMRFVSWNVRSMYRPGAAAGVERELVRYGKDKAA
ncbi:hypothetical protein SK128_014649, partial [Halocaridina rubra]